MLYPWWFLEFEPSHYSQVVVAPCSIHQHSLPAESGNPYFIYSLFFPAFPDAGFIYPGKTWPCNINHRGIFKILSGKSDRYYFSAKMIGKKYRTGEE